MKITQCLQKYHGIMDYRVVIINPKFVKENLNLESLPRGAYLHLNGKEVYPHNQTNCIIQHHSWFKDTTCGQFAQNLFNDK